MFHAIDNFPQDDHLWRIEWIGGVGYNTSVPSDPQIDVCLAQLPAGGKNPLSAKWRSSQTKRTVKISSPAQTPNPVSVCHGCERLGQVALQQWAYVRAYADQIPAQRWHPSQHSRQLRTADHASGLFSGQEFDGGSHWGLRFKGSTAIRGRLTAKSKLRSLNILLVTDSVIRIINRFTSVANSDV
jgi:hypothetical protein